MASSYLPKLASAIQQKTTRTKTALQLSLNIVAKYLSLQREASSIDSSVDALVIPMISEPWFFPFVEKEDAKQILIENLASRLKSTDSSKETRGLFMLYISERDNPRLSIIALCQSRESGDYWFFSDVSCIAPESSNSSISGSHAMIFCVKDEKYSANTLSTELSLTVAKFALATGWLPL
jgi:hypothetical protein